MYSLYFWLSSNKDVIKNWVPGIIYWGLHIGDPDKANTLTLRESIILRRTTPSEIKKNVNSRSSLVYKVSDGVQKVKKVMDDGQPTIPTYWNSSSPGQYDRGETALRSVGDNIVRDSGNHCRICDLSHSKVISCNDRARHKSSAAAGMNRGYILKYYVCAVV